MKNLSQYIGVAYRRSQVFYNEQMSSVGLTSGQYMYIIAVCKEEGLSQDDLAHTLRIDKGTVANVLAKLEEQGFVSRRINKKDKREREVYPTVKAQKAYELAIRARDEWHRRLTMNFSEEETAMFGKLLERAMHNAERHCRDLS